MLNEDQLNLLPERICSRLERVNQHWLEIMGKRIKEIGALSATDAHRLAQMKDIGGDVEKITAELMRISGRNAQEIYDIYDLVAADNVKFSEQYLGSQYIPYEDNAKAQQYVNALSKQAVYDYANFSHNTAMMTYKNGKKVATSLHDVYTSVIDDAITAVTSGQTDFYSTMRSSLKQLADSGLRTKYTPLKGTAGKTVDYATNYSRRLDTAVRQNLLWGIKQCNLGIQEQIGKSYGADGWEIDYHSNPRPSHAAMGGRQYHNGPGIIIDGVYYPPFSDVADLLEDYGCLHFKWPIICGVSAPSKSPEELAKLKELDKAVIDFEGEGYTRYEMSQIQRKLETKIRHAKDRQIIAKAAGDDELRRREQAKINLLASKYAQVSKAAGLPTRVERMRISGYHRVKTLDELHFNGNSAIIKTGLAVLDTAPRLKKHGVEDCYCTTNPLYQTGSDYQKNCQRCVSAYEARRRGYDVTAAPRKYRGDPLSFMGNPRGWDKVYENGVLETPYGSSSSTIQKSISQMMATYGEGSRAIIRVQWRSGNGHVFIAEQIKGSTQFIDPQSGILDCSYYFDEGLIEPSGTRILRIEDKQFTDLISECVK